MSRLPLRAAGTWMAFAVLIGGSGAAAFGQASAVRAGSVEVGPFIGASYGLDSFHVMGGGNITYALKNKWVLPYFEYSYFPGLARTVPISNPLGISETLGYSLAISDFHGGVHIRLPIKESRFVPYLVFGVGGLHFGTEQGTETLYTQPVQTQHPTIPGGTDFAFNGGGGIRYYIGGSGAFGIRVEAKIYHDASASSAADPIGHPFGGVNFGKVEAGFFFQLH